MFFPRLRRQAKWVFVLLIIAFAGGFVLYGVGTGQGGLEDLLTFNRGNGSPSISKLQKEVQANPSDAAKQLQLARAYEADGRTDEAIPVLERYTALRPKDADVLTELSNLYLGRAGRLQGDIQVIEFELSTLSSGSFGTAPDSFLARETSKSPLYTAVYAELSRRRGELVQAFQDVAGKAVSTLQQVTKLQPDNADVRLALADTAEKTGDLAAAIAAYKDFLRIAPDDSRAPFVKERVKQLEDILTRSQTPQG